MDYSNNAIGVFDSGLGGLTSVKELKKVLPKENIIYFGDTGRVPYGTRSFDTILKYAREDMNFLTGFDIKAVLIACGTVSAIALDNLQSEYELPIIGVVEPAAREACRVTENGKIAVLGTPAAVRNGAYERNIRKIECKAEVIPVACSLLVPLVESGHIGRDDRLTHLAVMEYLEPLKEQSPDVLILGCTHYPIIKDIIYDAACELFGKIKIVDAGAAAVGTMKDLLTEQGLLNQKKSKGQSEFYVSDETHNFIETAEAFLGEKIKNIAKINIGCQ